MRELERKQGGEDKTREQKGDKKENDGKKNEKKEWKKEWEKNKNFCTKVHKIR